MTKWLVDKFIDTTGPCVINCTNILKVGKQWHPPSGSSDDRSTNMRADPSIIFRA